MAIEAIRTVVIYVMLVAAMRVMGKRQLSDLQPVELVVTLLVADMAAVAMENTGVPLASGLIPIAVLVSLELLFSGLILKWPAAARLVGGRPIVLIRDGVLDQRAMKKLRLSVEDVTGALRQQGVFDPETVQCAVVETGGTISLCLKPGDRPATAADVGAAPADTGVPFVVVSDGKISHWGLQMAGQDEDWLHRTLQQAGCAAADIFLLTADKTGKTYLIRKEEKG